MSQLTKDELAYTIAHLDNARTELLLAHRLLSGNNERLAELVHIMAEIEKVAKFVKGS